MAPPKAEILVWLLLLGKLNTKGRLKELNIIRDDKILCPFCMSQQETISHLFFDCNHTWKIWCSCFSWWGYSWCCHNQPRRFFDHWLGMKLHGFQKKLWISLFFVVIWSIWYERNQAVFLNKIINWENVNYLIKLRLGYWVKGWCHEFPYGPEVFAHNLEGVRTWGRRI